MYTGQIMEETPIATPLNTRAAMNCVKLRGMADSTPDSAYRIAQKKSTLRRPNRSLMNPALIAPGMQPRMAAEVARPIRNESVPGSSRK